jgi:hypothetical protein
MVFFRTQKIQKSSFRTMVLSSTIGLFPDQGPLLDQWSGFLVVLFIVFLGNCFQKFGRPPFKKSIQALLERKGKGKEFRWVSNTLARGPRFGPNVLPIFLSHFPFYSTSTACCNQVLWKLQCKFLHFKSTRADVHYASASFGTTPPTYITLPYPGFEPGTFGFQVGNATN